MTDPATAGAPGSAPVSRTVERLSPLVERLLAPNPGPLTGAGTNTYFIGDSEDVIVLDPGPVNDAHLSAIARHVSQAKRLRIFATHTHRDHSPGVRPLALELSAETFGKSAHHMPDGSIEEHDHTFQPEVVLRDGDEVEVGGAKLTALLTPGHASNHFCFALNSGDSVTHLFTGDHVMQGSTVVVAPPDGNMSEYLDSLARLMEAGAHAIAPGHGALMHDSVDVLTVLINHRLAREDQVFTALDRLQRATPGELVGVVYPDLDKQLVALAERTVWAHLRRLSETGKARLVEGSNASVSSVWALGEGR